ncbi:hypothetical protein K525DRAFT_210448 [Schizophyllum commune Loenen D]|nr:hypothetical protein K525DRAFT_210448 [Schizophyllum commune Loenen D]
MEHRTPTDHALALEPPWDGWPDGHEKWEYTLPQLEATEEFKIHWATTNVGGIRNNGSVTKSSWEEAKVTRRRCNGVIECTRCTYILRPQTRGPKAIATQLEKRCPLAGCGSPLVHIPCGLVITHLVCQLGGRLQHPGKHNHPRPPPIHMTAAQTSQLEAVFKEHPDKGPLALIVGHQGRPPVSEISSLLYNVDRIYAERRKFRSKDAKASFPTEFATFDAEHPDFLVRKLFGEVIVVSMQTTFMRTTLLNDRSEEKGVQGIVTDAAHKFWKERHCLLIISSVYSVALRRWVPGLMTYANGATSLHYTYHYLTLLETMQLESTAKGGGELEDRIIANVVDFSQAQREGFMTALVAFWCRDKEELAVDEGLIEEYRERASKLIKGCQQHFNAQVTRVSSISGVISPDLKGDFQRRARSLLDAQSYEEFHSISRQLRVDYPNIAEWLDWWEREPNAQMLFKPDQVMDDELWEQLPDTTNAEEAMHNKLYAAIGRDQALLPGLRALHYFAVHFEKLNRQALMGGLIRYGRAEPWKRLKDKIGRTKRWRAGPRPLKKSVLGVSKKAGSKRRKSSRWRPAKNDGRPKDTAKELIPSDATRGGENRGLSNPGVATHHAALPLIQTRTEDYLPGVRWRNNSCWLDASFQLFYYSILGANEEAFHQTFAPLAALGPYNPDEDTSPVHTFIKIMVSRLVIEEQSTTLSPGTKKEFNKEEADKVAALTALRDRLRQCLVDAKLVKHMSASWSCTEWASVVFSRQSSSSGPEGVTAQQSFIFGARYLYRQCTGEPGDGFCGHYQLQKYPTISGVIEVPLDSAPYKNDLKVLFNQALSLPSAATASHKHSALCWRQRDGEPVCTGTAFTIDIFLSIPCVLILRMDGEMEEGTYWRVPTQLYPLTVELGQKEDLVYDLVGRVNYSQAHDSRDDGHYTCQFTPDGKAVYMHDGMRFEGRSRRLTGANATVKGILGQSIIRQQEGGSWPQAIFYRLRGGTRAQRAFYSIRKRDLAEKYPHILLSDAPGPFCFPDAATRTTNRFPSATIPIDYARELSDQEKTWQRRKSGAPGSRRESPEFALIETRPEYESTVVKSPRKRKVSAASLASEPSIWKGSGPVAPLDSDSDADLPDMPIPALKKAKFSVGSSSPTPSQSEAHDHPPTQPTPQKRVRLCGQHGELLNLSANSRSSAAPSESPGPFFETPLASEQWQGLAYQAAVPAPPSLSDSGSSTSTFTLSCRCGDVGDGASLERNQVFPKGNIVQCDGCSNWSHLACQRDGRASWLAMSQSFFCDSCTLADITNVFASSITSKSWKKPGQGCLVRLRSEDPFWYPARLIQQDTDTRLWTVHVWRLVHFCNPQDRSTTDLIREVSVSDIADEYWGRAEQRRSIRLGMWTPAWRLPKADDVISDFRDVPFSPAIGEALAPHRALLTTLLLQDMDELAKDSAPELLQVPCVRWVLDQRAATAGSGATPAERVLLSNFSIAFEGPLAPGVRAQVANWVWQQIPGAQQGVLQLAWFGKPAMAHAETIVIAHQRQIGLLEAWEVQKKEAWSASPAGRAVDVDAECIALFERKMFERSEPAGLAGNWQWGLDAGPHQHDWHPDYDYDGPTGPPRNIDGDKDEEERQVSHLLSIHRLF